MASSISPFLMFQDGEAEAAMEFYAALFPASSIETILRFGPEGPGKEGAVMTGILKLNGQTIMFLDSPAQHDFTFTPAISLFVECADIDEIEQLFAGLSDGGQVLMPLDGYPFAQRFGWVNDRFGVSWQLRLT